MATPLGKGVTLLMLWAIWLAIFISRKEDVEQEGSQFLKLYFALFFGFGFPILGAATAIYIGIWMFR